jgi:poly(3-hydroxybutyrate) depolymerase
MLAYQAAGPLARVVPVIVFHGANDPVVNVINAEQLISQWVQTNSLAASKGEKNDHITATPITTRQGQVPNGYTYTTFVYADITGQVVLEKWIIQAMGHSWSGGSSAGSYTDPKGPDASEEIWRFFLAHPKS